MSQNQVQPLKPRGRDQLERIIWMSLFTPGVNGRRGLPFVFVGDPGTGKTSRVKQVARIGGMHFESIIGSLRDPSDFLGVGIPTKLPLTPATQHLSPDGDDSITIMSYAPPNFAVRCALHKRAVLLIDEVNTCPPAVQAALLRLLFEGVCGELELPQGVRMLLAMNKLEDAAGGWKIAAPLANRVGWLQWDKPEPQRFAEFLMGAHNNEQPIDPNQLEKDVDDRWSMAWARAAGLVAGFTQAKEDLLLQKPKAGSTQAAGPWPSPRSWELTARAIAGCEIFDLNEAEKDTCVAAFVGGGPAGEFHTWVKNNDLPNPADFLDGIVPFKHNPARLDRTAAVLTACTTMVADAKCERRKERAEALWGFNLELADQCADISLGSVVAMCQNRLMIGSSTAYKVLAKMEPVMTAAGITPESR